ncbi:hypothetical protein B0H11DRAFT_1919908 [Mycena galericulata]|nr:hypothetical protein B0H11DRAFT_1919908 [Mycena galericulata]
MNERNGKKGAEGCEGQGRGRAAKGPFYGKWLKMTEGVENEGEPERRGGRGKGGRREPLGGRGRNEGKEGTTGNERKKGRGCKGTKGNPMDAENRGKTRMRTNRQRRSANSEDRKLAMHDIRFSPFSLVESRFWV